MLSFYRNIEVSTCIFCLPHTTAESAMALFSKKNETIHQTGILLRFLPHGEEQGTQKRYPLSDLNDPLDSGIANPSWLISSQSISQHLFLLQTQELDIRGGSTFKGWNNLYRSSLPGFPCYREDARLLQWKGLYHLALNGFSRTPPALCALGILICRNPHAFFLP